jgi:hypothetical protein
MSQKTFINFYPGLRGNYHIEEKNSFELKVLFFHPIIVYNKYQEDKLGIEVVVAARQNPLFAIYDGKDIIVEFEMEQQPVHFPYRIHLAYARINYSNRPRQQNRGELWV